MSIHDIYSKIRNGVEDREEIERAIDEVIGKPRPTVKDFPLP